MKERRRPGPPGPPHGGGRGDKFPPHITALLEKAGLDTSSLIYCCMGDMDNEGCYCLNLLCFDSKGIYTATCTEETGKPKKRGAPPEPKVTLNTLVSIPIDEADTLETESYTATGRLVSVKDGDYSSITLFSIGKLQEFANFAHAFNTYKEKGVAEKPVDEHKENKCRKCGAPCPPDKEFCRRHNKTSATAVRLFKFFGGYVPQMTVVIAVMLLSAAANVFIPQVSTRSLYDDVLANPDGLAYAEILKALGSLILTVFALRLVNTVLTVIQEYMSATVMPGVMYDIKVKIFESMQRLSVGFYSSKQTGSLMNRVTRDANNIYWFFTDGIPRVIIDSATVIGVLIMMVRMSPRLSLIALIAAPIMVMVLVFGDKSFRRMHHRVWVFHSRLNSTVSDNINGQRVIKAFAKESDELERFKEISNNTMEAELSLNLREATVYPIFGTLVMALSGIVLAFGGVMVSRGQLTAGTLLSYVVYLGMLSEPFSFLAWVSNWWSRCADSAQRVFEICDAKPDITEKENAVSFENLRGDIEINELEFEYEPARPVIKKLSLSVKAGDMLGIVGKTGAGKSTIANLIARLYDAGSGCIKIDGIDVRDLKLQELRRNIGLVSQDIYLFTGSIADNIRYARPDASMDEVIAASKAACAHDFIMKLPDAYETWVGAGGQKLSGGEKQRVSIARTIIQNPRILILDEATAAMDTETERNIQASLNSLKTGRTTIAIAHRLSTLRDSDYLAVIDDGKITEYGTYAELLRQKGEFYKQYKIQSEALKNIGIGDDTVTYEPEEEEKNEHGK